MYDELYHNAITLAKLDALVEVKSIFGILAEIWPQNLDVIKELKLYGVDVRMHFHEGKLSDPNRKRKWTPSLTQSPNTWHYDKKFIKGEMILLKKDELPVFHVDYPEFLRNYIDWLYKVKFEKLKIYI